MRYKGFYIKISPDSNIRRVDKTGRDILVLSISLDTFYSNKNYAARKI